MRCLDDKDESIRLRGTWLSLQNAKIIIYPYFLPFPALDLLYGMVGKKNLMEIVKKLMVHMEKAEVRLERLNFSHVMFILTNLCSNLQGTTYRDELLCKIIKICSQNNYQHITNFEW